MMKNLFWHWLIQMWMTVNLIKCWLNILCHKKIIHNDSQNSSLSYFAWSFKFWTVFLFVIPQLRLDLCKVTLPVLLERLLFLQAWGVHIFLLFLCQPLTYLVFIGICWKSFLIFFKHRKNFGVKKCHFYEFLKFH